MVESLKYERLTLQKENKVLIAKLVNREEFPALQANRDLKKGKLDKGYRTSKTGIRQQALLRVDTVTSEGKIGRFSQSLDRFSGSQRTEELKHLSLTPSFLVENRLDLSNKSKTGRNKMSLLGQKHHLEGAEGGTAALEVIQGLKRDLQEAVQESNAKTEQLISLQGVVRDMTFKMREVSATVANQHATIAELKVQTQKADHLVLNEHASNAKVVQELIDANGRLLKLSTDLNDAKRLHESFKEVI